MDKVEQDAIGFDKIEQTTVGPDNGDQAAASSDKVEKDVKWEISARGTVCSSYVGTTKPSVD